MSFVDDDSSSSDGSDAAADIAFSWMDLTGVDDFDTPELGLDEKAIVETETALAFGKSRPCVLVDEITQCLVDQIESGDYMGVLKSEICQRFLTQVEWNIGTSVSVAVHECVRQQAASCVTQCFQWELIAIAALNLFLQANYTGPSMEDKQVQDINPHACFRGLLRQEEASLEEEKKIEITKSQKKSAYQNAVLSELAVEGTWPVHVAEVPYFLLLARSILHTLCTSQDSRLWNSSQTCERIPYASELQALPLWAARATVAHQRLLDTRLPSELLWEETQLYFNVVLQRFDDDDDDETTPNVTLATVMLELGLAEHHFDRPRNGKASFDKARKLSGLEVTVTGALGKRTKYQQDATAQYVLQAASTVDLPTATNARAETRKQMIEHTEDGILLEKIKFNDEQVGAVQALNILDQAILLALCLDVKNSNPADGLTAEEMGAYLARVLDHHDDWMVYATALLERSWLEFERSHARERAILQMQALADQHTNRLTITQSTRESIEESAPVQDRLRHLHTIVYPPRWSMIQDLADRYANLGIVTSAAELFMEIEMWGDVVDCYRRAGRTEHAEKIVREQLRLKETPRMWEALGDLTKDPSYYEKAVEVSHGRYSSAYLALASHQFDNGQLDLAAENYKKALAIRPHVTIGWFRLGTISMQLKQWDTALQAFSQVVQQEPTESDAWANVAAVHMHNKRPAEAYPALVESLKFGRNNWRVWISKLYTCLDLSKLDEAIQACNMLIDLRTKNPSTVPFVEEKCVRAIVGSSINAHKEAENKDSTSRTLGRVKELLEKLSNLSDAEPWVFEVLAFFNMTTGQDEKALDSLLQELRTLRAVSGWEKDDTKVSEIAKLATLIHDVYESAEDAMIPQNRLKCRFLLRSLIQGIERARVGDLPPDMVALQGLLKELEAKLAG